MAAPRKNYFDRYFDGLMKDPEFAQGYMKDRQKIDAFDKDMRKKLAAARESVKVAAKGSQNE